IHSPSTFCSHPSTAPPPPHSFPTRRSSDLIRPARLARDPAGGVPWPRRPEQPVAAPTSPRAPSAGRSRGGSPPSPSTAPSARTRSEEHTSELQSHLNLVCRLLLEKKNKYRT